MSKEDVINYVMTTPNNPNRAVLEGMLEETSEGSGDLLVHVSYNNGNFSSDKTYAEIEQAVLNGQRVYATMENTDYLPLTRIMTDTQYAVFSACIVSVTPTTGGTYGYNASASEAIIIDSNGHIELIHKVLAEQ